MLARRLFLRALAPLAVLVPFRAAPAEAVDGEVRIKIESDGEYVRMYLYVGDELYGKMLKVDAFREKQIVTEFAVPRKRA